MQQQKDQMAGQQADQMKMMQWTMLGIPLFFFSMFNDYSLGPNLYHFISLSLSAVIMWALCKTTNEEKLLAVLGARREERKNNPKNDIGNGLFARMQASQESQKQQQEELRHKQDELNKKEEGL